MPHKKITSDSGNSESSWPTLRSSHNNPPKISPEAERNLQAQRHTACEAIRVARDELSGIDTPHTLRIRRFHSIPRAADALRPSGSIQCPKPHEIPSRRTLQTVNVGGAQTQITKLLRQLDALEGTAWHTAIGDLAQQGHFFEAARCVKLEIRNQGQEPEVLAKAGLFIVCRLLGLWTLEDLTSSSPDSVRDAFTKVMMNQESGTVAEMRLMIRSLRKTSIGSMPEVCQRAIATLEKAKLADWDRTLIARAYDDRQAPQAFSVSIGQEHPAVTLQIGGNDFFRKGVLACLEEIGRTHVGQRVLHEICEHRVLEIYPPSEPGAQRVGPDGTIYYDNSADGTIVNFDPRNEIVGRSDDPKTLFENPWRSRQPTIGLFHEILHVLLATTSQHGRFTVAEHTFRTGSKGEMSEHRIVGLQYQDPKYGVVIPFDDVQVNPITENVFRSEYGLLKGIECPRRNAY